MGIWEKDPLAQLSLPPGFRFYPTDEELLVQYLCRKVAGHEFSLQVIGDIDLYKFDPWDLPSKALFGEKEWYFFSPRDRKYANGSRPNRVAGSGYWKATGTDKVITTEGRRVGIKKALVFYIGKAPKGTKTNWIMHEYRLLEPSRRKGSSKLDDWVLCRIYKKGSGSQKAVSSASSREDYSNNGSCSSSSSHLDDVLNSLPEIDDRFFNLPRMNSLKSLLNDGSFEWATLAGLNSAPELGPTQALPSHCSSDAFVPSVHPPFLAGKMMEEEVQSGLKRGITGWLQQNSVGVTQTFGGNTGELTPINCSNSVEPVGFGYPTQPYGFGFRQ